MITKIVSLVLTPYRYVRNSLDTFGLTRSVTQYLDGQSQKVSVEGLVGVEDIAIDKETGIAYLSAADRRLHFDNGIEKGGIWSYDLNNLNSLPRLISAPDEHIFPHGLALWRSPDGHLELYVVDHANHKHSIRRYRVLSDSLRLIQIYEHKLICSPNDLSVVGDGEFYVSNDHYFTGKLTQEVEHFTRMALSKVVYVKDDIYQNALSRIPFANGVCWHHERKELFIAAMTRREVWACDIKPNGMLVVRRTMPTSMCVDNIEIGSDGWLWIGGHPQILKLVQHVKDDRKKSPSQVIKLHPETGEELTIYENDGSELSGSSVGANWRNRLLVGSVMEPFMVDCTLNMDQSI